MLAGSHPNVGVRRAFDDVQPGPRLRALYLCYLSLEDPLVQTQVIAYLEGLARRGHAIRLITFEPKLSPKRRNELAAGLRGRGIAWHALRYHKRPSLPATIYDVLAGAVVGSWLVLRHRVDAVHARSHVPAASALIIRFLTRRRLIFDIRGLMGEEYVDAGRWPRDGIAYRITDSVQRASIRRADGIVVLTERVREYLFGPAGRERTYVIPCCADVDRIVERSGDQERVRSGLDLGGRAVMVYVGKLAGRYMEREMVEFFTEARRSVSELCFVLLTQSSAESVIAQFERAGIPSSDYRITRADPEELGGYLAAADFAVCFYRPTFSEIAASPTKVGEYLGAGLPVVTGPGIGDLDRVLGQGAVGAVLASYTSEEYRRALDQVLELVADPGHRERCRTVARKSFSLEDVGIKRYDDLYREVAAVTSGQA